MKQTSHTSLLRGLLVCALALALVSTGYGFALEGRTWPAGTTILMQTQLGAPANPLIDGTASFDQAVTDAMANWNTQMKTVQFSGVKGLLPVPASGDGINSVFLAPTVFGQAFGDGTLAVTYYLTRNNVLTESDIVFNNAVKFDVYSGPLRNDVLDNPITDLRRVALHELGHVLGLDHPDEAKPSQNVVSIMNSQVSDQEVLSPDDIIGVQSLYGAPSVGTTPAPAPTPDGTATPTPTPTGTITPTPTPSTTPSPTPLGTPVATTLGNISTRLSVGTGDNVLIGGFIINGTQPKKLLVRATGPSLSKKVAGALADPMLMLYDGKGQVVGGNHGWKSDAHAAEIPANLAPEDAKDSAVMTTVAPGSYTAVVSGADGGTGIALVEAYDLDQTVDSKLANISTRGFVQTSDKVLIGGLIVQGATPAKVIIRGRGPSLPNVPNTLQDPMLDLYDKNGVHVASNDNWQDTDGANISATGLAPTSPNEAAILATLDPGVGNYTAIVSGKNGTTGVGLVEVYNLQ